MKSKAFAGVGGLQPEELRDENTLHRQDDRRADIREERPFKSLEFIVSSVLN